MKFIKKITKNMAWKLVPGLFNFQRILCKKDADFDITYLRSLVQKFHFAIEFFANTTQKDLELAFRPQIS